MNDQFRTSDSDDRGIVDDRESSAGISRWVKVAAMIAALVALLVVVALLAGGDGGGHGPSQHGSGGPDGEPTPTGAAEVHQPPEGAHS